MPRNKKATLVAATPLKLQVRILARKAIAMGPGKARLLEAIVETGSISAAARRLGMSYRRAWVLVDTMNRCFAKPLVTTATGGKSGGGALVTGPGRKALQLYQTMERKAIAAVTGDAVRIVRMMAKRTPR